MIKSIHNTALLSTKVMALLLILKQLGKMGLRRYTAKVSVRIFKEFL
jgi:hypothetical protein